MVLILIGVKAIINNFERKFPVIIELSEEMVRKLEYTVILLQTEGARILGDFSIHFERINVYLEASYEQLIDEYQDGPIWKWESGEIVVFDQSTGKYKPLLYDSTFNPEMPLLIKSTAGFVEAPSSCYLTLNSNGNLNLEFSLFNINEVSESISFQSAALPASDFLKLFQK